MLVSANVSPARHREGLEAVARADAACVACVSKITASRALADPDLPAGKSRAKVVQAMRETGYVQHFAAALTGVPQSASAREKLRRRGAPVPEARDMTDHPIDMPVGFPGTWHDRTEPSAAAVAASAAGSPGTR